MNIKRTEADDLVLTLLYCDCYDNVTRHGVYFSRLSYNLGLGFQVPVCPVVLRQDVGGDYTGLLGDADSKHKAGPEINLYLNQFKMSAIV